MSALITMPRMGETMETGRVAAWLKKPGDVFERGETIAEIETDKVTVEMPALDSGRLVEILAPEGTEIAVGAPLGRYDAGGASAMPAPAALAPTAGPAEAGASTTVGTPIAPVAPAATAVPASRTAEADPRSGPGRPDRLRATPLARRIARHAGIELSALAGTGRRGRVERCDVEAVLAERGPAQSSSMPPLQVVSLPQGRMAYRDWLPAGAPRRTIMLLHGFSADSATWAALASMLARGGSRVVIPDLPGHGATAIEAVDMATAIEAAAAFVQALGLDRAELLAHSMGAVVAARLAAAGRLKPTALTLVAPAGLGGEIDADFVHGMATLTAGGALAHLLRRLARRAPTLSRPQLDAMARDLGRGRLRGLAADLAPNGRQGLDIVADLAAVRVPTRLIWGLDDRIIPWTHVTAAPSRVAIHLIADAGHMPHWDKPQDLAALLA